MIRDLLGNRIFPMFRNEPEHLQLENLTTIFMSTSWQQHASPFKNWKSSTPRRWICHILGVWSGVSIFHASTQNFRGYPGQKRLRWFGIRFFRANDCLRNFFGALLHRVRLNDRATCSGNWRSSLVLTPCATIALLPWKKFWSKGVHRDSVSEKKLVSSHPVAHLDDRGSKRTDFRAI